MKEKTIDIQDLKMKKTSSENFYSLPLIIKENIQKHINTINSILINDEKNCHLLLKEILSAYDNVYARDRTDDILIKNYIGKIKPETSNDLLGAVNSLINLIQNDHVVIIDELDNIKEQAKKGNIQNPLSYSEYEAAISNAVVNEFISLSNIPIEEIKNMGELYENFCKDIS